MQVPSLIEQDLRSGRAVYRTYQTGAGGQSILEIGQNQYAIIFGYVFSPAGTGLTQQVDAPLEGAYVTPPNPFNLFATQQILFYTGDDFYPFVENVSINTAVVRKGTDEFNHFTLDTSPKVRSTYIRCNQSISIAVGLLDTATRAVAGSIPVTEYTPPSLSYGGSGINQNVQTDIDGTPLRFLQPKVSGWNLPPYAYGIIPPTAGNQVFSVDPIEPSSQLAAMLPGVNLACLQYYLTIHYALYNAASDTKIQ